MDSVLAEIVTMQREMAELLRRMLAVEEDILLAVKPAELTSTVLPVVLAESESNGSTEAMFTGDYVVLSSLPLPLPLPVATPAESVAPALPAGDAVDGVELFNKLLVALVATPHLKELMGDCDKSSVLNKVIRYLALARQGLSEYSTAGWDSLKEQEKRIGEERLAWPIKLLVPGCYAATLTNFRAAVVAAYVIFGSCAFRKDGSSRFSRVIFELIVWSFSSRNTEALKRHMAEVRALVREELLKDPHFRSLIAEKSRTDMALIERFILLGARLDDILAGEPKAESASVAIAAEVIVPVYEGKKQKLIVMPSLSASAAGVDELSREAVKCGEWVLRLVQGQSESERAPCNACGELFLNAEVPDIQVELAPVGESGELTYRVMHGSGSCGYERAQRLNRMLPPIGF